MQVVFDFMTGAISAEEFKHAWYSQPEIGDWLDHLIDMKSPLPAEWDDAPYSLWRKEMHRFHNGSVRKFIEFSERTRISGAPMWVSIGWYFEIIASVMVIAFPEITPTTYYTQEKEFYLTTVNDSLGGPEVEGVIGSVMSQFPYAMGKTKRREAAKAALRERFHIEKARYPRWVQSPEWPMGANSPMKYLSQKRDGEQVVFVFFDVDTGETRVVKQFY